MVGQLPEFIQESAYDWYSTDSFISLLDHHSIHIHSSFIFVARSAEARSPPLFNLISQRSEELKKRMYLYRRSMCFELHV